MARLTFGRCGATILNYLELVNNNLGSLLDTPRFHTPIRRPFLNYLTQEPLWLVSAEHLSASDRDATRLVAICNQPAIYHLVAQHLNGQTYTLRNAQQFLSWSSQGWRTQSHFVFFVRTTGDEILGSLVIKSAARDGAEIGYWADPHHPGFMTQALLLLLELARRAAYRRLFALITPNNLRSERLVLRAGFSLCDHVDKPEDINRRFGIVLR